MGIELKPPIFLLGNVRSGTSMMHDFFDAHPEVVGWYEPRTVWTYAAPARRHDLFSEEDATPAVIRYIRRRFLNYQLQNNNLRVMEKTPSNLLRIPYVRKIFPESKYLYMIREPLANLSSSELRWQKSINRNQLINRLNETPTTQLHYYLWRFINDKFRSKILKRKHVSVWGVRYSGIFDDLKTMSVEEVIAKQWVECSKQAEKALAAIDPELILRLSYEDFVRDPVPQFEKICKYFDISFPDALAKRIEDTVDPSRQQKWKRLEPAILEKCLPILKDEMTRHGYSVPDELIK